LIAAESFSLVDSSFCSVSRLDSLILNPCVLEAIDAGAISGLVLMKSSMTSKYSHDSLFLPV